MKIVTKEIEKDIIKFARIVLTCKIKECNPGASIPLLKFESEDYIHSVFVTLKKDDKLRGCIGRLNFVGHFEIALEECIIDACNNDYRFKPVEPEEVDDIKIEISLLSKPEILLDTYKFDLGKHGIIVEYENKRGIYLPEVPIEQNWNIAELCYNVSKKAEIIKLSEVHKSKYYKFETQKIKEE